MLLAIDPGNDTGLAFFREERLVSCRLIHPADYPGLAAECRYLGVKEGVIEKPTLYREGKADPEDIKKLRAKVRDLVRILQGIPLTLPEPREWKKQVPKAICHARARKVLTGAELLLTVGAGHDVWDAICLGLWRLKRR